MKSKRVKRALTSIAAGLLCMSASIGLTSQEALASAYGVQYWGGFTIDVKGVPVGIPSGQLAHQINGSGRTITSEWGHISAAANICNWRIDYVYFGMDTKEYRRIRGGTRYRCDRWAYGDTVYPGTVNYGRACAQLYSNGVYITRQCHSITG